MAFALSASGRVLVVLEEWRPVGDVDGYEVSDLGRIRSIDRVVASNSGRNATVKSRRISGVPLRPSSTGTDRQYLSVTLRARRRLMHRLVAEAFLPNPDGKPQVNHINGLKGDNSVLNLEWVSGSENMWHSTHVLGRRRGQFVAGRCRR